MNSYQIGDACEILVLEKLSLSGIEMAIPFGNQRGWDILAKMDGTWYELQVKSVHLRNSGSLEVDCIRSGDPRSKNRANNRKYEDGSFDWLIAVHLSTKRLWKIPFSVVAGRRSLVLTDMYLW